MLNNYWETNFKAETGGFYEFRYTIRWGADLTDAQHALDLCRVMNTGVLCYR